MTRIGQKLPSELRVDRVVEHLRRHAVEDRGVSDMMITLADCLQDYLRTGISDEVLREQIRTYAES